MRTRITLALTLIAAAPAAADVPVTLRGSPASMVRQHDVAKQVEAPFVKTLEQIPDLESAGELVPLVGNDSYGFAGGVQAKVARPEMRTFVERLSAQYRAACGERLIVTSLTRATANQPHNSHPLSIHPTGLAVDFRISQSAACRGWLEGTLLALEDRGLLDITREKSPPHYHVALFPEAYAAHVERLVAAEAAAEAEAKRAAVSPPLPRVAAASVGAAAEPAAPQDERSDRPLRALLALPLALLATVALRGKRSGRS